ncbi:low affinity iron permease family protein [Chryseobacterium sp. PS-8]|uniref:Low affinity iron permease family protein n=1 Tax=Chryseobacterium indicum TaxID=2766954 RepID=A0ABS9C2F6_9FLAO|nr:low affinity iron permease family protein [Chryseobacterium sp. PS-8]MCF2218407.1 low affinity iron permease family protein [Chryseobacterium sp. PS-8]
MKKNFFDRFADRSACFAESPEAFIGASVLVIIWAATGPFFKFSEVWQMVINTGTTIVTFLMVFLIQKAQNKDSKAIQIKLNELIKAHDKANNRIVDIEDLTEDELDELHKLYENSESFPREKRTILPETDDDAAKYFVAGLSLISILNLLNNL